MEHVQQQTKTFIWSMFGNDFIQKFERFGKLALVDGKHITSLLSSLIEEHIEKKDIPGTLVDEKELLENLQIHQLSVSRVTLRNYRIRGKMTKNGKPIWFTDGRNICYHLEDCLEFFKLKGRKSKS
jgi:hypothetical protein